MTTTRNRLDMAMHLTLTDYTYKYRSDAPPDLAWDVSAHTINALQNETVACQLVIETTETALLVLGRAPLMHWTPTPRLRIALGAWQGPQGPLSPSSTGTSAAPLTEAFFVGLVPADAGDVLIADPLLHEESIEAKAHCPQAVWLSIRFPAGAAPGRQPAHYPVPRRGPG